MYTHIYLYIYTYIHTCQQRGHPAIVPISPQGHIAAYVDGKKAADQMCEDEDMSENRWRQLMAKFRNDGGQFSSPKQGRMSA
jgi:hypothetical protein